MLISIIIPSFRQPFLLQRALESIALQTFKDYEIIVVDGNSQDETQSVIDKFSYMPLRFYTEPDKGIYDAMNKGIRLANGKWLYFLGCDDILYGNDVFTSLEPLLLKTGLTIIYGDVMLSSSGQRYAGLFDLERLLISQNICHQAVFYCRIVFSILGDYNLKYKLWSDWDYNIRCFSKYEFEIEYFDGVICLFNDASGASAYTSDLTFLLDRSYKLLKNEYDLTKSPDLHKKMVSSLVWMWLNSIKQGFLFSEYNFLIYKNLRKLTNGINQKLLRLFVEKVRKKINYAKLD